MSYTAKLHAPHRLLVDSQFPTQEKHTDLNSIKAMIFSLKAWPILPLVFDTRFAYTSLVLGLVVFLILNNSIKMTSSGIQSRSGHSITVWLLIS